MNNTYQQLSHLHNALANAVNQAEKEMMTLTEPVPLSTIGEEITEALHVVYQELSIHFSLNLNKVQVPEQYIEMVAGIRIDNSQSQNQKAYPVTSVEVRTALEDKFVQSNEFLAKLREAIQAQDTEEAFVQYANLYII